MKIYLYNPPNGASIKNWYDGSSRWSLDIDEVKQFPEHVADKLAEIFGFLQKMTEEEAEAKLAQVEALKPAQVKVGELGQLVPKTEEEVAVEVEVIKEKKEKVKKLVKKVKEAKEAKPENPPYEDWSRGELIAECHKRKIEIKGLGKNTISKQQIIMLLENNDNE